VSLSLFLAATPGSFCHPIYGIGPIRDVFPPFLKAIFHKKMTAHYYTSLKAG